MTGRLSLPLPLLPLVPALVLLPVTLKLISDLHVGGLDLVLEFWTAALTPSLDAIQLLTLGRGALVTLLMGIISWLISCAAGMVLGLLCSRRVAALFGHRGWLCGVLQRLLAPLRALHELVWGLLLLQFFGLNGWVSVLAISCPYAALMARVVADQIDNRPSPAAKALHTSGASASSTVILAVLPEAAAGLVSHMGHRLDCALRSAILLGVFGLGGLGTDLSLSLQSLRFHEVWTGLWMLALLMMALERLRQRQRLLTGLVLACLALTPHVLNLQPPQVSAPPWSGSLASILQVLPAIPWVALIGGTLLVTAIAAALAIGLPPLILLLAPTFKRTRHMFWALLRLMPAPLTALLLLLLVHPSAMLAGVALGLHHAGVMGRVMEHDLMTSAQQPIQALRQLGSGTRTIALIGQLAAIARPYLSYGLLRGDVILRDTAVVGMVGGAGLGWQLIDALGSFHWDLVVLLLIAYVVLTLSGELISSRVQQSWCCKAVEI